MQGSRNDGDPFPNTLAHSVLLTSDFFRHEIPEDIGEKTVFLNFGGFGIYMSKLPFMISSNIVPWLVQYGNIW